MSLCRVVTWMKFVLALTILLSLLSPSSLAATESASMDGNWWRSLPEATKVYVVQGMITAFTVAWSDGYGKGNYDAQGAVIGLAKNHKLTPDQQLQLFDAMSSDLAGAAGSVSFSKTFDKYVDEINDFYANYPNATQKPVGFVLGCLTDKPIYACHGPTGSR